ncbi:GxxExxY protein [Flavobacterium sp.]|uniref:GxxExxY protein n=1 Tax=Flavobacterium sp. TaxID=239 RepID=UPI000EC554E6|nr:GxxExxY protein [Flavobacterium sp.]HCQ14072.1 GxxExxY protein [Flavobacterium sp.]
MEDEELTYQIRGCIFNVYNKLGPGLFESVYEAALCYELNKVGLKFKRQLELSVHYEDIILDVAFRIDILVENKVIIEIKSVEELSKVHYKQIITYLKLTSIPIGLLVNFNTDSIKENIKRIVNNHIN